jgi:Peptidase family S41
MNLQIKWVKIILILTFLGLLSMVCRQKGSELNHKLTPKPVFKFDTTKKMSKSEMFIDFDTLVRTLDEIYPQIGLKKVATNVDIIYELKQLRLQIDTCNSSLSYFNIVRKALAICQDSHLSILPKNYFEKYDSTLLAEYALNAIPREAITITQNYRKHIDSLLNSIKLELPIKYIDGEYYTISSFSHQGKYISSGAKLVTFNNENIHTLVNSSYNEKLLQWDNQKKQFYDNFFYKAISLSHKNTFNLSFEKLDGSKISISLDPHKTLDLKPVSNEQKKKISYFEKDNILYIRMPNMFVEDTSFYSGQIKNLYKDKKIKKVIIDIRDNKGGSDLVGINTIKSLINEPIKNENVLLVAKQGFTNRFNENKYETIKIPFLDSEEFSIFYKWKDEITPSNSSIAFKGNIYIIQNDEIYSAAGTLSNIATYSNKIISIGQPTGRMLGRGIDPILYTLPYSKLIFRIEPLLDLSGVNFVSDAFHDQVEMPIKLSPKDIRIRLEYPKDIYSKEFLYQFDPVFKHILNLP